MPTEVLDAIAWALHGRVESTIEILEACPGSIGEGCLGLPWFVDVQVGRAYANDYGKFQCAVVLASNGGKVPRNFVANISLKLQPS